MRWVVSHPEEQDKTQAHKHCRAWLKAAPSSFLMKLADLEKAHAARAPVVEPGKAAAPLKEDEGPARVRKLIGRLLGEDNP